MGKPPKSDASRLWRQYAPFLGAAITVLGFGIKAVQMYDAHEIEDQRRDERLRVLERITVSEHPEYSSMLFP
jgi:hypothetical protein